MADKTAIQHNTGPSPTGDNTDNTEPISAEIATFIAEIDCPHFVNVAATAFYGFLCVGQHAVTFLAPTGALYVNLHITLLRIGRWSLISPGSLDSPSSLFSPGSPGSLVAAVSLGLPVSQVTLGKLVSL